MKNDDKSMQLSDDELANVTGGTGYLVGFASRDVVYKANIVGPHIDDWPRGPIFPEDQLPQPGDPKRPIPRIS